MALLGRRQRNLPLAHSAVRGHLGFPAPPPSPQTPPPSPQTPPLKSTDPPPGPQTPPPSPQTPPPGPQTQNSPVGFYAGSSFASRLLRNVRPRKPEFLLLAVNKAVQPLPCKETLSLFYCTANTSSPCPRGRHSIFQSCLQQIS